LSETWEARVIEAYCRAVFSIGRRVHIHLPAEEKFPSAERPFTVAGHGGLPLLSAAE
jgi:hypothetical protein